MPASFVWQPGPNGGTPTNAANLNKLAVVADIGTPGTPTGDALKAAFVAGRACSTDGTSSLPAPTGVGLEFVITTTAGVAGLQDIRFNGTSL